MLLLLSGLCKDPFVYHVSPANNMSMVLLSMVRHELCVLSEDIWVHDTSNQPMLKVEHPCTIFPWADKYHVRGLDGVHIGTVGRICSLLLTTWEITGPEGGLIAKIVAPCCNPCPLFCETVFTVELIGQPGGAGETAQMIYHPWCGSHPNRNGVTTRFPVALAPNTKMLFAAASM